MKKVFRNVVSMLALVSSMTASAATVLQWGGEDFISSNTGLSVGKDSTTLSFGSYSSPTVGSSYYDPGTYAPGTRTPNFYSAGYAEVDDGSTITQSDISPYRIDDNGSNDELRIQKSSDSGQTAEVWGIMMWQQADFINGGDTGPVTLNSMSGVTSVNSGNLQTRFVAQLGSNYYVTENLGEGSVSISDPLTTDWFNYSPTADYTSIGSAATLVASDFENLDGAGIFVYNDGNRYNRAFIRNVQVDASVIPEPSSLVLIGLAGIGAMVFSRKRK